MKKLTSVLLAIILGTMSVVTVFAETPKEVKQEIREEVMKPRAGVITKYSEIPVGSSSAYTVFISSSNGSNKLGKTIGTIGVEALANILLASVGISGVAGILASTVIASAVDNLSDTIYFHETIMGHKDDSWAHRKKIITYYHDANHKYFAGTATVYINQYWY